MKTAGFQSLITLLAAFLLLQACAPRPELSRSELREIDDVFVQLGFDDHFSGLAVTATGSSEMIYARNENKLFTPASNLKLLTWYAVGQILPDTLPTYAWAESADTIFIKPFGDPSFLHPEYAAFQKGIRFLREKAKPVIIFAGEFADQRYGPGWSWDDYPYSFQREKTFFPVMGNALWILDTSGMAQPEIFPNSYHINVSNEGIGRPVRSEFGNQIFLGTRTSKDKPTIIPLRMSDSLVADILRDTLFLSVTFSEKKKGLPVFADTLSATPADTLLHQMLRHSDNFVAEQLLLMCSRYAIDRMDSGAFIDSFRRDHSWIDRKQLIWRDGSGLSIYNKCSPAFITRLLERLVGRYTTDGVIRLLPQPGKEGTLENWPMSNQEFLHAKSGSLSFVYNLSGILRGNSGKYYLFSFMNNNFTLNRRELQMRMARLLEVLHKNL